MRLALVIAGIGVAWFGCFGTAAFGARAAHGEFVASRDGAIVVMNRAGRVTTRLTRRDADAGPLLSPDGRFVVFNRAFVNGLFVVPVSGGRVARVTRPPGDFKRAAMDREPAWSPDARHIAFVRTRWIGSRRFRTQLLVVDRDGGGVRTLVDRRGASPDFNLFLSWSPDGRTLAAVLSCRLVLIDAATARRRLVTPAGVCADSPIWSPQGDRLLVHLSPLEDASPGRVAMIDRATGAEVDIPGCDRRCESGSFSPDGSEVALALPDAIATVDRSGLPSELFACTDCSVGPWTPTGDRFLVMRHPGGPPDPFTGGRATDLLLVRKDGTSSTSLPGIPNSPTATFPVAFSPTGDTLIAYRNVIAGSEEGPNLAIFDLETRGVIDLPLQVEFGGWLPARRKAGARAVAGIGAGRGRQRHSG